MRHFDTKKQKDNAESGKVMEASCRVFAARGKRYFLLESELMLRRLIYTIPVAIVALCSGMISIR